jgi:hypothetical protein
MAPVTAAQTVGAPLQVRTGEVYTISVEQSQTTDLGENDVTASLSHVYALHIVDAENRIWRYMPASLTYSLPTGLGIEAQAAALNWPVLSEGVSAMLRIATDIGIECRVDEFGRCIDMTNWPAWRDRAENLIVMADAFARMVPETPAAPSAVDGGPKDEAGSPAAPPTPTWSMLRGPVLRGLAAMLDNFDSRDAAASMASIETIAGVQGRTLARRQSVPVTDELEMPFGASPLRFTGTVRLERIDQRNNTATVVRRVSLDQESARATLRGVSAFLTTNMVEPVAQAAGEGADITSVTGAVDTMLDAMSFQYQETTTGTIDLTTGMAREATTDYTVTLTPPSGAGGDTPLTLRGRTIIRVTQGAPDIQRLPRG